MAIIDWSTMTAWDMLSAGRTPDGGWISSTGIRYSLDGSGVFDLQQFPMRDGVGVIMAPKQGVYC